MKFGSLVTAGSFSVSGDEQVGHAGPTWRGSMRSGAVTLTPRGAIRVGSLPRWRAPRDQARERFFMLIGIGRILGNLTRGLVLRQARGPIGPYGQATVTNTNRVT
jgi:hypothetical protein